MQGRTLAQVGRPPCACRTALHPTCHTPTSTHPPSHRRRLPPAPCSDLNLEFEVPFRELGFFGVPHRTNSFIMPTVNCLVELTEMPFTVLTLGGARRCP